MRQRNYSRRRSALNLERLAKARQDASDFLALAKHSWVIKECNKIPDVSEKDKWRIINKLSSSSSSSTVQPIEIVSGSGDYAFSDIEIRSLMEKYHVSKGEDSSSLDSEFNDTVSSIKQTKFNSSDKLSPDSASLMHSVITESEVSLSFGSSDGSPGPDGISAKWIDQASRIEMSQCLLFVFNLLWKAGSFHSDWKCEIRAILAKLGRPSYHFCDSYRTISLTNLLGKRFEKISCRRLIAILEDFGFDECRYAYLIERSATQAITLFNQKVCVALDQGKACGAIFFDLKDAFGSVRRSILIEKLARDFGISGLLLDHLCDFLSDRKANLKISGDLGE